MSYDAHGRQVPRRLQAIFAGRRSMLAFCDRLAALRKDLCVIGREPYCRDLDVAQINRLLETIRARIMQAAPFEPCDCHTWEYDCPKCHGLRWLTARSALEAREPMLRLSDAS